MEEPIPSFAEYLKKSRMAGLDKLAKQLNRGEKSAVKRALGIIITKIDSGASYTSTQFTCGWIDESSWFVDGWRYRWYDENGIKQNGIKIRIAKRVWDASGNPTDECWEFGAIGEIIYPSEIFKHL